MVLYHHSTTRVHLDYLGKLLHDFNSASAFIVHSLLEGKFIYNQEADQECSVSTGFGATDDGIGCITVLQLIRFFTTPGNKPKKGVVALLNNGEEDYLNGRKKSNFP